MRSLTRERKEGDRLGSLTRERKEGGLGSLTRERVTDWGR